MTLPALDQSLIILLATVALAGLARGLTGFGTGMIVAPVAGAFYGAPAALVIIAVMDLLPTIPVTLPALKHALWREVIPVFIGMAVFFPLGIYVVTTADPVTLRWIISLSILTCVASLAGGRRYHGPRNAPISLGVGGVAGVLSGIAQIPGPPVIIYWMASALPVTIVRANLLTLFFLGEFVTIANLWHAGLLAEKTVAIGIAATPFYFAGILAGWALFGLASEAFYRAATFALIIAAALLTLPLVDRIFG
jgi:uncharacterized protein